MKLGHWIAVAGMLYFVATGINEFLSTTTPLDGLPDAGAFTGATSGSPDAVAGGIDLAVAAAIYFLVLHKRVMG
jgi:hypothetical protein